MHKKVLSEIDLYYGKVDMPKGFEIDRTKIKNDIIESQIKQKRINNNPEGLMLLMIMLSLFLNLSNGCKIILEIIGKAEYYRTLVPKHIHGNIMRPKENLGQDIKLILLIYVIHQTIP